MARSGRIGDIDRGIDRIGVRRKGLERDMRGERSGTEVMRGEGMMSGRHAGYGKGVIPLGHLDGDGIREIGITTAEDEE